MSVNKVILVGNVGQDPEIKVMQNGGEVANFSLATTENWKDKITGEKKERTDWHRIVVFSSGLVNIIKNYVRKGTKLYVEGQLQSRKWTDKDNIERFVTEIVLNNFNSTLQILSYKDKATNNSSNTLEEELDDNIPF